MAVPNVKTTVKSIGVVEAPDNENESPTLFVVEVGSRFENATTFNGVSTFIGSLLACAAETANRVVRVRLYSNPTLAGSPVWQYVDQNNSVIEYSVSTGVTITAGSRILASISVPSGAPGSIDLEKLNVRLSPGQILAVAVQAASNTAVCVIAKNWIEL